MTGKQTLYQFASEQMTAIVAHLIELSDATGNFQNYPSGSLAQGEETARLLLAGRGFDVTRLPDKSEWPTMWLSRAALPFRIEKAAATELYMRLGPFVEEMVATAFRETASFSVVTPEWVKANAHLLPIMMHAVGTFSKQELARQFGAASDTGVSAKASERLVAEFNRIGAHAVPEESTVRERMKGTTEGIVRDLIGRLLLEEFVVKALRVEGVPFLREREYESLAGVVYDFRADFVVPDARAPKAFIEVRKSSDRHASLYAKDKMFSAINWKGRHKDAIGVLVTDGPWTEASLNVLASIFDYVVPIGQVAQVARRVRQYLDGDKTALRWLITFKIEAANPISGQGSNQDP